MPIEVIQVAIFLRRFPACGWALHYTPKPPSVGCDFRVFPVEVADVAVRSGYEWMRTLVRTTKRRLRKAK